MRAWLRRTELAPELILLPAAVLLLVGLLAPVPGPGIAFADVDLYYDMARRIVDGAVPYRDLAIEYPPLALIPIVGPLLVPTPADVDLGTYAFRFLAFSALQVTLLGILIARSGMGSPTQLVTAYLPFAILLTPVIAWRYDIFPALLTFVALAAATAGRPVVSALALAAAILSKAYALPLAALLIGWQLARGMRRAAVTFGAVLTAAGAMTLVIFALPDFTASFVWHQLQRGIQIESLWGGVIGIGRLVGVDATVTFDYGAHHVTSPWSRGLQSATALALPATTVVVVCLGWLRLREDAKGDEQDLYRSLAAYSAAVLLAMIVTNKVLSPQYLIWLLPFMALLRTGPRLLLLAPTLASAVAYPFLYPGLVAGEPLAIIATNLRNAALVAALIWIVSTHWPQRLMPRARIGGAIREEYPRR